jgi:hypothetical protein
VPVATWHAKPTAQSKSPTQYVLHALLVSQTKWPAHATAVPGLQAFVLSPEQVPTPASWSTLQLVPPQLVVVVPCAHVDAAPVHVDAHSGPPSLHEGRPPCGCPVTWTQLPSLPATSHASQVPLHAALQQYPSTQNPDVQLPPPVHRFDDASAGPVASTVAVTRYEPPNVYGATAPPRTATSPLPSESATAPQRASLSDP